MSFPYTSGFIDQGLSYTTYRTYINNMLSRPPADEAAEKMRPYIQNNTRFMEAFDASVKLSDNLIAAVKNAPSATWILLTEGWCGDAAFCVPVIAALEKAFPKKITLRLFLRDSNSELMDAHLTNGGRSIPKLVVLNEAMKEIAGWGPRPADLQTLMNDWKNKGFQLKEIIPRVHEWYYTDDTKSTQEELEAIYKNLNCFVISLHLKITNSLNGSFRNKAQYS